MPRNPQPPSKPAAERYAQAIALLQCQRPAEAASILGPLTDEHPNSGPLWVNLAAAYVEADAGEKALHAASPATELLPHDADAWANLGLANRLLSHHLEASIALERAISCEPHHAGAWLQLAECHEAVGDLDGAMTILDDQLRYWQSNSDSPAASDASVIVNLMRTAAGRVLLQQRRASAAFKFLSESITFDPLSAEANNLTGVALRQMGRPDEALRFYTRAVRLDPTYASAHLNRSHVARQLGKLGTAADSARIALSLRPDWPAALSAESSALRGQGRIDEAVAIMDRALLATPPLRIVSNALSLQQYRDGQTPASLQRAHRQWGTLHQDLHGDAEPGYFPNARPSTGPLRIGFLSPDFGRHPVGYFLTGLLSHLPGEEALSFCYNDRGTDDSVTRELKRHASQWRNVAHESTAELTRRIRRDRIDVLVDLAGHTDGHRLELFAGRAAPMQVSWIGYVGTLGVPNIDAVIADPHHVTPEDEPFFDEAVLRLPNSYVCYQPPNDLPPVPPYAATHPVLAAYHNPAKLSAETIAVWSDVLAAVPDATLRLMYWGMRSPGTIEHVSSQFASCGIDPTRLQFCGAKRHVELLASYADVAVLLDPLAYSGGLTTCEAIAMGVPVVTKPGQTFASRHASSYLHSIGRSEWVADSLEAYVEIASSLAVDQDRLARERLSLRGRMAASPLCDYEQFARDFTEMLAAFWAERYGSADDNVMNALCA